MKAVCLHDRTRIERFLRQNTFLQVYAIGDLDDFFWQFTTWYALLDAHHQIRQLALLYTGTALPIMLGITDESGIVALRELLDTIRPYLPRRFYAHFSGDVASALNSDYHIVSHGLHYKMGLTEPARLNRVDTSRVISLSDSDLGDLLTLYKVSYANNAFDPRMLETGQCFGIRQDAQLVCVAGIHTYSPHYKVAAVGNVTTHPAFRRQGFATAVCARLCQSLLQTVDHVGLNVKADNLSAIACYENLGFSRIANYEEYALDGRR